MNSRHDRPPLPIRIENPQAAEYPWLLSTLLAHLPAGERQQKLSFLLAPAAEFSAAAGRESAVHYRSGLFVVRADSSEQRLAAIWVHPAPGRTALVGSPQSLVTEGDGWRVDDTEVALELQVALIQQAIAWAARHGVEMLQAVTPGEIGLFTQALQAAGMEKLVELLFLVSPALAPDHAVIRELGTDSAPQNWQCQVVPPTEENRERWYRVLAATYIDSQDCPAIQGRRSLTNTLDGYLNSGVRLDRGWVIAQSPAVSRAAETVGPDNRQDLACLILADHPAADFLELIYFGAAPAGRGQGIGQSLLAEATQIARSLGRSRIVAAVDRKNLPTLRVYLAADYQLIEEKSVFAYFYAVDAPVLDRPA